MKTFATLTCVLALAGCARFSTIQTDVSTDGCSQTTRTITTKATSYTLFSANSRLATWKASQTDKSQGAAVGGLEQNATNNLVESLGVGIGAALKTMGK